MQSELTVKQEVAICEKVLVAQISLLLGVYVWLLFRIPKSFRPSVGPGSHYIYFRAPIRFTVKFLVPVFVQKVNSFTYSLNQYPVDNTIGLLMLIHWIVVYPVDSAF